MTSWSRDPVLVGQKRKKIYLSSNTDLSNTDLSNTEKYLTENKDCFNEVFIHFKVAPVDGM